MSGVWRELYTEKEWRDVLLVKVVSEWGWMEKAGNGEGVMGCITSQGYNKKISLNVFFFHARL